MRPLRPLFTASFFFSFHVALLSYLNSSVLATVTSPTGITLTYTAASLLSLVLVILAPGIARRYGASRFLIGSLGLAAALLWLLSTTTTGFILCFVLYFSLNTVIWYAFDLVLEHYTREQNTGNTRGAYLALNNIAWIIAPVITSGVATRVGFAGVYVLASIIISIAFVIIAKTKRITTHQHIPRLSIGRAFSALLAAPRARRIVTLYFALQFFFAWMVIYMAPYLEGLGFSWATIGIIFSVMLLPFGLLQYPVGKLADRYHAERPLIIVGFSIAAVATMFLAAPLAPSAVLFAGILFMTRVGASIIEVGCESAFFKEVTEQDTALISTLRMTLPLAYIIAPLTGALVISLGSIKALFGVLSIILALAMIYAVRLSKVAR